MAGFDAEEDTIAADPGFEFGDARRRIRALRAGWLHDSRRQFGYSIGSEEGFSVEAAAEMNRTALGSDADGGAAILDVRGFHRVFSPHAVFAARVAVAGSWGPEDDRRVFSAAGPGASAPVFDFGRDTIGLLRGFNPEDVVGSRTAVANLDLRFPLWRIERGPGTLPAFLRIVHAAVFADAGNAWESRFRAADVRGSAGAELSFDTTLIHYFPYTFATGVAWTHDRVAGASGVQFFGRVGYAF
jgi:outer membrane protein assembly factor BamA